MTTTTTTPLIDLLAARWIASQKLTDLYDSIMCAFETAFPSAENAANISMAQRQTALAQLKSLVLESNQAAQELMHQGAALVPALNSLEIESPQSGCVIITPVCPVFCVRCGVSAAGN